MSSVLVTSADPKTWIALFRGINVGGSGRLAMKDLVRLLGDLGLEDAKTYIQSGNVVFRSTNRDATALAGQISREVGRRYGFEPAVLILDLAALELVVRANPFPEAVHEPTTLHVLFLESDAKTPDLAGLERRCRDTERFELHGRAFYLHVPEGIARSKVAAGAEKLLGVPVTGRNWRSVTKILALAREAGQPPP